jgi:HPt (histidine-containing phosphotransfer) domain-containing protein
VSRLDETALRGLVAVFLLDAPSRLDRIELQLDTVNRARLPSERTTAIAAAAHEAHSLSGAAETLRLEPLATHLERLELALRNANGRSDDTSSTARARELLGTISTIVAELRRRSPAHHRALGSSNQNVEPAPAVLSKPIAPPCA